MENYISIISEILEVETVELSDELNSFEAWDSLAVLSIIAFCDSEYSVALSAEEINNSGTILGLKELIEGKM
ncbi:acyl carrier protein [Maribacter arenosus]|jgi:acyl carrier protein|uniref:Acyl carrier protein n=1 Tax=Maribacter arenosus TaxID=1854708 RepID=A0ABR7V831_9FLAO|nr:acyl carrier protein [Maribacter arenosus]MBD0849850.1 acyl carrier protein [Maribacter arenosus]